VYAAVCFFFSSRRRHTISKRDWSSDVCSSDLTFLTERTTKFDYEASSFQVPLLGKHHAKNAAFAIWLAHTLHVTNEQIQTGLQALAYTSMRFEWIQGM